MLNIVNRRSRRECSHPMSLTYVIPDIHGATIS